MRFLAGYLILCAVRMVMPQLTPKTKLRFFVVRVACAAIGWAVAYWGVYRFLGVHLHKIKDPDSGVQIMWEVIVFFIAVGEFISHRMVRSTGGFTKAKMTPWTY